jgi:UDP-glucuronate 4-epimerase
LGLTYHGLHGVPVVIVRPFSVYGPGLRPDLALSIFANAILTGRRLPLFGDGSVRRDYTHVADICDGIRAALHSADCVGQAINLGHSQPLEIREVIARMEQALDRAANVEYLPARDEDLPVTFADLGKAQRLLGYNPQVPFAEGIVEYCQWYKGRMKDENFK